MKGEGETRSRDPPFAMSFEGALLKDSNPFPYFMLVAFEASGVIRFSLLFLLWPLIWFLGRIGSRDAGLKVMVFVATAGVKVSEVEWVARAVLPKFYMEDLDVEAWRSFMAGHGRKVVVTGIPRVMVEMFAKEHLRADEVAGGELEVNRFGYATGFVSGLDRLRESDLQPSLMDHPHPPNGEDRQQSHRDDRPDPVIFHDGRLVPRPTPATSLLILLWLPLGAFLASIRILVGVLLPMRFIPYAIRPFGGRLTVRGRLPTPSPSGSGTLFVCTHRTLMDPVVLSVVLGRTIPAVTYSISRLSELLSPIPTVPLTRDRRVDSERIRSLLADGDLVVCPEGTTCREPFLLRFSALFAELTDRIVPVAMNHRVGFFHATTARGWKGLDSIFFMMNPRPEYEVTFLSQLPAEATVAAGRRPEDVANYVQKMLAATLGFECTNYTRKDKYRVLAGNDGTVVAEKSSGLAAAAEWVAEAVVGLWRAVEVH